MPLFALSPPSYVVGIVGCEAKKFTEETKLLARRKIREILSQSHVTGYSSGHCHLGGIDIWTEEIGDELSLAPHVFPPKELTWRYYRERNLRIVAVSRELHCITLTEYPPSYDGMRFARCYHCQTDAHVKSGGCWTAREARRRNKPAFWHMISSTT